MTPTAIIYSGIAMFFLTLVVLMWLGVARYTAIRNRSAHSYMHLGSNNVTAWFFTFISSVVLLTAIWVSLLVSLLAADT